jgi:hypothetical protein
MKEILASDFEVTVNNASATTFYGDGTNITGVETLSYYSWVGLLKLTDTTSTLIKIQGDEYFGELSITEPYDPDTGVDITSDQGAIFTPGKTFIIPPSILYAFSDAFGTSLSLTDTTIRLRLGTDVNIPPSGAGLFSSFEIKVFK